MIGNYVEIVQFCDSNHLINPMFKYTKKWIFFSFFIPLGFFSSAAQAQTFAIGKRTENFTDPDRNNRAVPTEVYYPATSAGANAPIAEGSFPLIVFGHGFVMSFNSYENISDYFVPKGYVVAFANTENSFSPNHNNFGLDLRFIAQKLSAELNGTQGTIWYQKFNGKKAVMGHSMGGGATMLAASGNTVFDLVVGLAPAETNPSAAAAAAAITAPMLIFAGSNDGVTPPPDHQLPIYNGATASPCKTYISINGGGHCFFANSSFTCEIGEAASNPQPSINRAQQQAVLNDFSLAYFETFLKEQSLGWATFMDSLNNSNRIAFQQTCNLNIASASSIENSKIYIYPNPATDLLTVDLAEFKNITYEIIDFNGRICTKSFVGEYGDRINIAVQNLSNGMYFLRIFDGTQLKQTHKFIVAH